MVPNPDIRIRIQEMADRVVRLVKLVRVFQVVSVVKVFKVFKVVRLIRVVRPVRENSSQFWTKGPEKRCLNSVICTD